MELSHRAKPQIGLIDEEKKMIPFILISKNNATERYDWWEDEVYVEELDVNGADYSELRTFFKDHSPSVDTAIGRVENVRVDGGELKADVYFGSDDVSYGVFRKYKEGILSDVSIGYRINDFRKTVKKDEPSHILVTDFRIVELSAVWRGADSGAVMGRQKSKSREPKKEAVAIPLDIREKKLKIDRRNV